MSTPVKFSDLQNALEWVSSGAPFESAAYVSRDTGEIFWASDGVDTDIELPEDIDDGTRYIAVPHKTDLELGRSLVTRFVEAQCPELYETIRDYFRAKGAYARYKDLLGRQGLLEAWHQYEASETEQALRQWAADNDFEIPA